MLSQHDGAGAAWQTQERKTSKRNRSAVQSAYPKKPSDVPTRRIGSVQSKSETGARNRGLAATQNCTDRQQVCFAYCEKSYNNAKAAGAHVVTLFESVCPPDAGKAGLPRSGVAFPSSSRRTTKPALYRMELTKMHKNAVVRWVFDAGISRAMTTTSASVSPTTGVSVKR